MTLLVDERSLLVHGRALLVVDKALLYLERYAQPRTDMDLYVRVRDRERESGPMGVCREGVCLCA